MHIDQASKAELEAALAQAEIAYKSFQANNLGLDLTRGKPSDAQLDLSNALSTLPLPDALEGGSASKADLRNYGVLSGLPEAKQLFGELLDIDSSERASRVFVGGNSSLSLMHYSLWFINFLGLTATDTAWISQQQSGPIKIICPCPGYDRHFSLCAELGIEMIPVALTGHGPDMDQVEALIADDPNIKGIWCVPRFSNPTGEVYDTKTVARIAALPKIAGSQFYIFWDNAYAVHTLQADAEVLSSIETQAKALGTQASIIQFGSTSKITFAGAGIGYMASSESNIAGFTQHFGKASIGPDKINQQRHVTFLKDLGTIQSHMARHAEIIAPKFAAVADNLETHLAGTGMGEWNAPTGGYFVSFETRPGLATEVVRLANEAGVKLTPAGATYPHGNDPKDSNIRIAPTYPGLEDVNNAMAVFVNCVTIASLRQQLETL